MGPGTRSGCGPARETSAPSFQSLPSCPTKHSRFSVVKIRSVDHPSRERHVSHADSLRPCRPHSRSQGPAQTNTGNARAERDEIANPTAPYLRSSMPSPLASGAGRFGERSTPGPWRALLRAVTRVYPPTDLVPPTIRPACSSPRSCLADYGRHPMPGKPSLRRSCGATLVSLSLLSLWCLTLPLSKRSRQEGTRKARTATPVSPHCRLSFLLHCKASCIGDNAYIESMVYLGPCGAHPDESNLVLPRIY